MSDPKDFGKLSELAREQWRVMVDEHDINEVELVRPDPDHRGAFIGPLARVMVGLTVENDEGEEVLDMTARDGRTVAMLAALPFFAELVCFIRDNDGGDVTRFIREVKRRAQWLSEAIDERDEEMGPGVHGLHGYPGQPPRESE